jgi:hypothetical protein
MSLLALLRSARNVAEFLLHLLTAAFGHRVISNVTLDSQQSGHKRAHWGGRLIAMNWIAK